MSEDYKKFHKNYSNGDKLEPFTVYMMREHIDHLRELLSKSEDGGKNAYSVDNMTDADIVVQGYVYGASRLIDELKKEIFMKALHEVTKRFSEPDHEEKLKLEAELAATELINRNLQ